MPITAFFGPYTPELEGTLRDVRPDRPPTTTPTATTRASAPSSPTSSSAPTTTSPRRAPRRRSKALKTGQLRRCPGAATQPAADGSSPFTDNGQLELRPHRDALMNRRRRSIAGGQPAADRRGHDADRRRRGVPLLQRQQRAAVRADLQHQGRAARGLGPAEGQPGAHRRHARGRHQLADALPGPRTPAASRRSPT